MIVLIEKQQWYSRSLNHKAVTKIENFDYGPLYNEQFSFAGEEQFDQMNQKATGTSDMIGASQKPHHLQTNTDTNNTGAADNLTQSQILYDKYQVHENRLKLDYDMAKLNKQKQTLNRDRSMNDFIKLEQESIMKRVSRVERRASETDTHDLPLSEVVVDWKHFNCDLYSSDKKFDDVEYLADANLQERIDLRPYMIENPYVCFTTDKFQKVLDTFRFNQCRQLCVLNPINGRLQGVIGREDLFAYMSL